MLKHCIYLNRIWTVYKKVCWKFLKASSQRPKLAHVLGLFSNVNCCNGCWELVLINQAPTMQPVSQNSSQYLWFGNNLENVHWWGHDSFLFTQKSYPVFLFRFLFFKEYVHFSSSPVKDYLCDNCCESVPQCMCTMHLLFRPLSSSVKVQDQTRSFCTALANSGDLAEPATAVKDT